MIIAEKKNEAQLMSLVSSIKKYMNEWQIVNVNIAASAGLTKTEVMEKLLISYNKNEGIIYPLSDKKVVMLVRLGIIQNYAVMKSEIEDKIPNHSCRVMMRKMSAAGLKQIQIDLTQKSSGVSLQDNLFSQREKRKENIILVADDDAFVLKSMSKLLAFYGRVVEASGSAQVTPLYLEHNPDIVLLDIHMPGKSGLDLMNDVMEMDPDAFIIILSADSMKENVMTALERGAAGFLTKPPIKAKLEEYLNQCITIR